MYQLIERTSNIVILEHDDLEHVRAWLTALQKGAPLWLLMYPPFPDSDDYIIKVI